MYRIPLSVPSLRGNEWKYVKECIDTEWVSSAGKYVDLFDRKVAEYSNSGYAVACITMYLVVTEEHHLVMQHLSALVTTRTR